MEVKNKNKTELQMHNYKVDIQLMQSAKYR
jgi:hypothetical protein